MHSTLVRPADAAPEPVDAATRRSAPAVRAPLTGAELPGRYVLLGELGRGGMGVVHAAYDTTLDRKVAIKLLRDVGDPRSHSRMLREARALARLSHPNVVAIYEVGEFGLQVFLAMELVEGMNLRAWLADRPRTRADILAVFLQAAEGLMAAHAAGLVHRDFKPDNVVIGVDGRVRVMDFGLARRSLDAPAPIEDVVTRPSDPQLTDAGSVLGTPAYMAPEQHLGLPVTTAAVDLYSFAVALYEALHGARPYQSTSTRELADRVLRGKRTHTVEAGRVPAWLQAVVDRGMALEPADRWPSMAAFAAALRRDPTPRRRLLAGLTAVGLVAATWFGVQHHREQSQIAACVAEGADIDAIWNDAVAADLRARLPAASAAYARPTLDRVVPLLAEHAGQWRAARTGACLDARVHHTLDADTHDRMTECLDDDRARLEALIAGLSRPDRDLEQFIPTAAGLPSIAECRDVDHLRRAPPLPADLAGLRAARTLLGQADIKRQTGIPAEVLPAVHAAITAAEQLGSPALIAEAVALHGLVLIDRSAYIEAEPILERAFFQAIAAGAPLVAARTAESLALAVLSASRHADALRWLQHGDALLAELGVPETGLRRMDLHYVRGKVVLDSGDYAAALAIFEDVLVAELEHFGPRHFRLAFTYDTVALAHNRLGQLQEARELAGQAVASAEISHGPDHPAYASFLLNFADILVKLQEHNEAIAMTLRAVAVYEQGYGSEHPELVIAYGKLAAAYGRTGRHDESLALYQRAVDLAEKIHGPDSFQVAYVLGDFSLMLDRLGRTDEALPLALRALKNNETTWGHEHVEIATLLSNIADMELALGDDVQARAHLERALAIYEALPTTHPYHGTILREMAYLATLTDRHADAVALGERSVKIYETSGQPKDLANARLVLAEALVAAGGDVARAVALARDARAVYVTMTGYKRSTARSDAVIAMLP